MNFFGHAIGSVKNLFKKIGDTGKSVLHFSQTHGIGSTLQNIGSALTVTGVALGATGILAPLAAVAEGLGGTSLLAGTALRAGEIASNNKTSSSQKLTSGLAEVALPLLLPSAVRGATRGAATIARNSSVGLSKSASKLESLHKTSLNMRTAPERFSSAANLMKGGIKNIGSTTKNVLDSGALQKRVGKSLATGAAVYGTLSAGHKGGGDSQ